GRRTRWPDTMNPTLAPRRRPPWKNRLPLNAGGVPRVTLLGAHMYACSTMTIAFVLMISTGCSRMNATAVESPQDGLTLRLTFKEDYSRFTVSVRNNSDHTIFLLDELRYPSKVRFASGPTEVYVFD